MTKRIKRHLIGESLDHLFELELLENKPYPFLRFYRCNADKRQWWLEASNYRNNYYRTSINMTQWKNFTPQAQAEIIKDIGRKLGYSWLK